MPIKTVDSDALHERARQAFSNHVIRKRDDISGRWILQKRYKDQPDQWDGNLWTEIVSLEGGKLYVGGDIDFVIFAYYSDKLNDHKAKVRWIGEHSDFNYYVHQKACIGTGYKLINRWDGDTAKEYIDQRLKDLDMEDDGAFKMSLKMRTLLEENFLDWDHEHTVYEVIADQLGYDWLCDCGSFGMTIDTRLYLTYAALQRLCQIWDEQDKLLG